MENHTPRPSPKPKRQKTVRSKKRPVRKSSPILKFAKIPDELKEHPYWAFWKGTPRENGKVNKPPLNPRTGKMARVNIPSTFASYEEAKRACIKNEADGIGILLTPGSKMLGVDIDDCITDGLLSSEAQDIIDSLKTYTEISPSGNGIRCIAKSSKPIKLGRKRNGNIEMYTESRFLTITGDIEGPRSKIRKCPNAFKEVHGKYVATTPPVSSKHPITLDSIKKNPLFNGDITGYKSASEADLALCRLIVESGNASHNKIDGIFRKSNLMRSKWNRKSYREQTITKALKIASPETENIQPPEMTFHDVGTMLSNPPPEMDWLIHNIIPQGQIGEMLGDGKMGKSSLLVQMAMAIASGKDIDPFSIDMPQKVMLVNVEDPAERIHDKVYQQKQFCLFSQSEEKLLKQNLKIVDGAGKLGPIMQLAAGRNPIPSAQGDMLKKEILKQKPSLVILDTKSRLYGLEENNNDHATQWLFFLEKIVAQTGCCFIIAHHTGKGEGKRTGRGASAFDNNTRFRLILEPLTNGIAKKFNLEDNKEDYFILTSSSNYSSNSSPMCFRRGEAGMPTLMNFAEQRWYQATELLYDLLHELPQGETITKQHLLRGEQHGKTVKTKLKDSHGITGKELHTLLRNLENKGRITFKTAKRGQGKIIIN